MRQGLIQANIALPMQTFLDSKQIAFQKNISNIKQKTDISFQFFCQLILTCQIKLCLVHFISISINFSHSEKTLLLPLFIVLEQETMSPTLPTP